MPKPGTCGECKSFRDVPFAPGKSSEAYSCTRHKITVKASNRACAMITRVVGSKPDPDKPLF